MNEQPKHTFKGSCFEAGVLPNPAGLTWELLLIVVAWISAFSVLGGLVLWVLKGVGPGAFGSWDFVIFFTIWLVVFVYLALIFVITVWLSNRYRHRQTTLSILANTLLSQDTRPHVLYLRPFKDDDTTSRFLVLTSEEQNLAVVMNEIGPFIAVGQPDEESADPGAARLYVEDDRWQTRVRELMTTAALVVLRLGNSEGLWWEVSELRRSMAPERLVLLVPDDQHIYESLRARLNVVLRCRMPEIDHTSPVFKTMQSFLSIIGMVYFDFDWQPHFQRLQATPLRQTFWKPGVPILKTALEPVYKQLGIEWKKPPLKITSLIALVALLILGVITIYAMLVSVTR